MTLLEPAPGSEATDAPAAPWFASSVVYQIYPRSFADSDGDGVGDLGGILDHLDHLERLGIDVVWLCPVYPSGGVDNGYDISDYRAVDPVFGTLEQLDRLIAALHDRGMRLVLDLVVNHTSDAHPWFVESRSSRTSPKRDWYVWRDGRDGAEPNNWGSLFSGPAWALDEETGQYYLHLFDRRQPDLNWENPEVRAAVHELMRWWLDRGVDGFRMDVINFVSKARGLPDAVARPGQRYADAVPLVADGPRIHEYLAEMHREVFAGRPRAILAIGETPGVTPEEAARYTDPDRQELDMVFQFEHVDVDHGASKWDRRALDQGLLRASLHRWQDALAERGWNSLYWNNHDQPRAVSRFGDDGPAQRVASAKALATVLHTLRGTPFVYQGEELGMTNYPFASAAEHRDVEAVNRWREAVEAGEDLVATEAALAAVARDNARSPMQWDASPAGGFTTATPWFPVNPNHLTLNAAAQAEDPDSVLAHYAALIRLRRALPVLAAGAFEALATCEPAVWMHRRVLGDDQLLIVANCATGRTSVSIPPGSLGARFLLGSRRDVPAVLEDPELLLEPWDARIYRIASGTSSARLR